MIDRPERSELFSCKPCPAAMLPSVLAGTAVLVLSAFFGAWLPGAAVCVTVVIFKYISISSSSVTVTDSYVKIGKQTVPLGEITVVYCLQGPAGKLLGYGTAVICTSDKRLFVRGIPQAKALRNEISKQTALYHFNRTRRQAEQARKIMEKEL